MKKGLLSIERYAIEQLHQDGFRFPSALVGELSTHTGDKIAVISLQAMVQLNGQQGHVAYPKAAKLSLQLVKL